MGGINNPGQSGLEEVNATNEAFMNANVLQDVFDLKAPLASPTFTGTVIIPTPFTIGAVSMTATGTELNFVDGVTSAIQTQLDAKAALASPTFTGTPVLPAATTVGGVVAGIKNLEITAYGAGTAYILTNSAAAVDLGTTDPAIVLNVAGTYLIMAQIDLAYNAATVVAETATVKVRRTNNTAADLSAVVVIDLPVSTTLTNTYGTVFIPPFVYTTAATDDAVTIFANVSAALSAGSIDATAIGTSIVAIRLY